MKKPLAIVAAVAFVSLLGFRVVSALNRKQQSQVVPEEASVVVKGAPVARRDLARLVVFTGQIRPKNEVEIFAKVPGRIQEVRVKVGDRVRAGDTLTVIEHEEISWQVKQAEATLKLAEAALAQAKDDSARMEALQKSGASTAAALQGAQTGLLTRQAQVAQAEAALGLARTALANARVASPIKGTVTRKMIDLGATVGGNTALFAVQDVEELKMEGAIEAAEAMMVRVGQPVQLTVDALPHESFTGTISVVSPALDGRTRRVSIEVQIPNGQGKLLPNMFARGAVQVGTVTNVLTIPRAAVFESAGGRSVYALRQGRASLVRPVFGVGDTDYLVVENGLSEGEEVAAAGLGLLADGAKATFAKD